MSCLLLYVFFSLTLNVLRAVARPGHGGALNEVKYNITSPLCLNTSCPPATPYRRPAMTATFAPSSRIISVPASTAVPHYIYEQNSLSVYPSQRAYPSAEPNPMSYLGKHPHSVFVTPYSLSSTTSSSPSFTTISSAGNCQATCFAVNNPGNFELWTYAPGVCDLDNKPVRSGVSNTPCS